MHIKFSNKNIINDLTNSAVKRFYTHYIPKYKSNKNLKSTNKKINKKHYHNKIKIKLSKIKIKRVKLLNNNFYKLRLSLKLAKKQLFIQAVNLKNGSLNKMFKRDYNNSTSFKPQSNIITYFLDLGSKSFLYKVPYDFLKLSFVNYSKLNYFISSFIIYNYYFYYFSCYFFSFNFLMLKQSFLRFFSFKFLVFPDFSLLINLFIKLYLKFVKLKPTHFFSFKPKNIISFDKFILKVDYATFLISAHILSILEFLNIMNIFEII